MPKYVALIKQYTIACGRKWIELKSTDMPTAREELRDLVIGKRSDDYINGYEGGYHDDRKLDLVSLIEVTAWENEPVFNWYEDAQAALDKERAEAETKARRKMYENLKKEFE